MESNDVVEQEELPLLEGEYQYPNASIKTFTSTKNLGEWLTFTRPTVMQVQTKQQQDGSLVYELQVRRVD